jgi:hypothetical protein
VDALVVLEATALVLTARWPPNFSSHATTCQGGVGRKPPSG